MLLPEERSALLKTALHLIGALGWNSPPVLLAALLTLSWRLLPEQDKRALVVAATAVAVLYLAILR